MVHDRSLTVVAPGVLTGADDPDGDPITAVLSTDVSHGTLVLDPDGSWTYAPAPGFVGTDSFTFVATDGFMSSAPATVTIDVTNAAPTVLNEGYQVIHDRDAHRWIRPRQ